jgi:transposase-like protein
MEEMPSCPRCNGKLKKSGEGRRRVTFNCTECSWTSDLRLDRARRIITRTDPGAEDRQALRSAEW